MSKSTITEFAQSVYDAVKLIPEGKISTYKLVAYAINKPNASRAVETALSKNPFAPIVPCHRVLTSSFGIGGFYGDTDVESKNIKKKIKMLKKEGITFDSANNNLKKCPIYRKSVTYKF